MIGTVVDHLGQRREEVVSTQEGLILCLRVFNRVHQGDSLAAVFGTRSFPMTPSSAPLDSHRFQSALLLLLGPLFIGVSFVLLLRRVEPVTTLFYLCAWYGIIWTLDRLIQWREGRSLIARCGPAFLLILFWSAVGWYAFELINFRLQNWYYIFVLDHLVLQTLNAVFSFATVFPGLLWLEYYLGLRGVAAGWQKAVVGR